MPIMMRHGNPGDSKYTFPFKTTTTLKATTTKTITFKAPTSKKCADMREGNPGDATHRVLSLTISHQMEIGPTVFLLSDGIGTQTGLACMHPLPMGKGWSVASSDAVFNEALYPTQVLYGWRGAIVHCLLL